MNAGSTEQFSANVTNTTNTAVTWTASGGTIVGSGLNATYTAPLNGGPFTITASSAADPTKSASASVTVTPVSIALSPTTASVGAGGTQQFTATVANSANSAVTWTTSGGTVSGTGSTVTWTAPPTGGSYTVTATSAADPSRTAVSTVTVSPVAIAVTPTTQVLYRGEPISITAAVSGTTQTGVTWTASCGVISGTGVSVTYTAAQAPGACTVTARSALDATKAAAANITVRPAWRVATFTDADDGACTYAHCTLREAIGAANAQPNTDTIRVVNTTAAVIALESALPAIATSTHIVGPGAALLTINANGSAANQRRGLLFDDTFTGSVSGMTIRGGVIGASGGAGMLIRKQANIALTDVTLVQNEVRDGGEGGGLLLLDGARAQLLRVVIDSNRVVGNGPGGGIAINQGAVVTMTGGRVGFNAVENGWAGGVKVNGSSLTMDSVNVQGNRVSAGPNGGGGMLVDGASTVVLTRVTVADNSALTGEGGGVRLLASANVTVTNSTISGNRASLAAGIVAGSVGSLSMTGTTVSGNTASTRGGGVYLWGTSDVTLANVTIRDNVAGGLGGGGLYMQNTARARLADVIVSGNRVSGNGNGGGIAALPGTTIIMTNGSIADNVVESSFGAGVHADAATLTLTGVTVRSNTFTVGLAGGGISLQGGASLTMVGGSVREHRAKGGAGGGILVNASGAQLTNVDFINNTSDVQGGGLQIIGSSTVGLSNVTMTGNSATAAGAGGAISMGGTSAVTIANSTFNNNTTATSGAAVFKGETSTLTVTDSRFTNNVAQLQGGALQLGGNGTSTLRRITVTGNSAVTSGGGGITNGSVMLLENSTVSGNTSVVTGGGIFSSGTSNSTIRNTTISGNSGVVGGGIGATGIVSLNNVTLVANTASDFGGGIGSNINGSVTVTNTILSGNLRAGVAQNCGLGGAAVITSSGNNLSDDATCTTFVQGTDKNNTAAGINTALAENGGLTRTHGLQAGSAAINAGNAATCLVTDQRGFARQGTCDIGAFEFGGTPPAAARRSPVTAAVAKLAPRASATTMTVEHVRGAVRLAGSDVRQR
jgi:CSLREA domain-containing protein